MDRATLQPYLDDERLRSQSHPHRPLSIYNYTERTQYEKLWDDVTLQCRGLVLHGDAVVARPFRKFFNDTEHAEGEIPWHLDHRITEKMDGSLLIVFWFDREWLACTRGSFTSEQSAKGLELLAGKYGTQTLSPGVTYLFEVIYPQNRVVVDYGRREDVVLLGMIETASGQEIDLDEAPGNLTRVRSLPPTVSPKDLRAIIRDDEEGYVVRFSNGFRIKVKGERYKELHKIFSGISSRSIWECLSQNKPLDDVLAVVPDEFATWVREESGRQKQGFSRIMDRVNSAYEFVKSASSRKEQAILLKQNYRDVMGPVFSMLDGKPCDRQVWDRMYPDYSCPANEKKYLFN